MRQEKQKTSLFSEYDCNENDSISSRQLEHWLKQTAPVVQPKFGGEWTLMSTNSIYEQDEHPLLRNETFESINKENDPISFNSLRQSFGNNSSLSKSKSYVNAMLDLQNKVKALEKENETLKATVVSLKEEKERNMSESAIMNDDLKHRLESMQPKARKLEQIMRENKKLRDWKEQNQKRAKMMEKLNNQTKARLVQYEKQLQKYQDNERQLSKRDQEIISKLDEQAKTIDKLRDSNNKLQQRNKILQDMKEKSTSSILEKYSKSVDKNQELTSENMQLKQKIIHIRAIGQQKLREAEEMNRKDREDMIGCIERLKQENNQKKEVNNSLIKQVSYFKENYEKANDELIKTLRKHSQQIKQVQQIREREREEITRREKLMILQLEKQKREEKREERRQDRRQDKREDLDINRESIIPMKEEEQKLIVQSHLQFDQLNQIQDQEVEESPLHQTRSVGKEKTIKHQSVKSNLPKPIDTLSQQNYRPMQADIRSSQTRKVSNPFKSKQKPKSIDKSQEKSHDKSREKSREKSHSREKEYSQKLANSNEHSFILKSCQPITQSEHPQPLFYSHQPHFQNSANNNLKQVPYYWDSNQIAQFGFSQRNTSAFHNNCSLDKAMLTQTNREAVRLIEQQQKLLALCSQNCSPVERAQNIGRLKQISEQIRVNNDRMIELKQKIANS